MKYYLLVCDTNLYQQYPFNDFYACFDYSNEILFFLCEVTKNWKQTVAWKLSFLEYLSGIHRPQKPYSANLKQLFLKDYLEGEGKAFLFFPF